MDYMNKKEKGICNEDIQNCLVETTFSHCHINIGISSHLTYVSNLSQPAENCSEVSCNEERDPWVDYSMEENQLTVRITSPRPKRKSLEVSETAGTAGMAGITTSKQKASTN